MNISDAGATLLRLLKAGLDATQLPRAHLVFERHFDAADIEAAHAYFTKPHPRFKLIRNKSVGIALLHLAAFATPDDYLRTVKKKDYAAHHARRARARGYVVAEIDQNNFIDAIHAINTSAAVRQGRPMDPAYLDKQAAYTRRAHYRYFGALNKQGQLMAYCNVAMYGNFAVTDRLLGYKNNDGAMYLMMLEIICRLIDDGRFAYFMYDTYLGAQAGLRNFKKRLGFQPYRVRYSLNN